MIFTDTHAHVNSLEFEADNELCFERSIDAGVTRVFIPNVDIDSLPSLKQISAKYPKHYYPMMGLHPCSVQSDYELVLSQIYNELKANKYYGVGEIGMDLFWDKTTYDIQRNAFVEQALWAIKFNLPVSIHSREATEELIGIIKSERLDKLRGVFHCFTGDVAQAETLIKMGFYLGIGGVVTYKNSHLPQVLASVGYDKIVLETDSPYLPPVPYRGKRNETSYIPIIAAKLAEIFYTSVEEIANKTTSNSTLIFGI